MQTLIQRAQGLSEGVQALEVPPDPSARQLRHLRATLSGYAADVRSLRDDLDANDIRDILAFEWPEDVIRAWQLERRTRRALVQVGEQLRQVDAVAETLERGAEADRYVTKSGDTWQGVAARLLGDWREWPRLVAANGGDPATLPPGTILTVPER